MNKVFLNLFALLLLATTSIFFTSCEKEEELGAKVTVRFEPFLANSTLTKAEMEGMKVVFTEVRNQKQTQALLDPNGEAVLELYKGTYDVSIEEKLTREEEGEFIVTMREENLSINMDDQIVSGKINLISMKDLVGKDFIFSEIFFNGERNSGKMMHPDQYIVVYNPTKETLYADGLSVAVTQHLAWQDKAMWYDEFYPNRVPIGGFITIPGSGKEHAVASGERFVIAFTATDHSKVEGYDHAVDLSGADYEIFYGPESKDLDNPNVPNVLLTENSDENVFGFFFQPRGYVSPLMFRLDNGQPETINAFVEANNKTTKHFIPANPEKGTPADTVKINIYSVETAKILDGVQTSDVPQDVKTRVIPETVDRGKFLVNGCHRQELAIRKTYTVDGRTFYQDTNDSSVDFIRQQGQNAFPVGWRDKQ